MHPTHNRLFRESGETLRLALPITAGHLGHMVLGLTDTLMIGQVGVVPLAAAALSNSIFHVVFVFGLGILTSVSVLASHAHGAGDRRETGEVLRHGCALAIGIGAALSLILLGMIPLLVHAGQSADVLKEATPYLVLQAVSIPIVLVQIGWKNFSEAQSSPWPAFWTGMAAVVLNIFLNWVFIFGNLGAPAMGLFGAGVATVIARIVAMISLMAWVKWDRRFDGALPERWLAPFSFARMSKMTRLGFPVALQILMEVGAFNGAAFMMGWVSVNALAAHQIAITCAATTFMVPLGLSLAVTIRVGQVTGAGQIERAARVSFETVALVTAIAVLFGIGYLTANRQIAGFFSSDPEVVALAAALLVIAGWFQLFDGIQAVAMGALRGMKDVRLPTLIVFIAFWVIALPAGSALAFGFDLGARGLWIGLSGGLGTVALLGLARLHWQCQQRKRMLRTTPPLSAPAESIGREVVLDEQSTLKV